MTTALQRRPLDRPREETDATRIQSAPRVFLWRRIDRNPHPMKAGRLGDLKDILMLAVSVLGMVITAVVFIVGSQDPRLKGLMRYHSPVEIAGFGFGQ
ncbi:MAG: hypothetical protein HY548_08620 [Elusimicrobia bacterium]|nr:hypothetical protein [Elusimicrobiota bacterium]